MIFKTIPRLSTGKKIWEGRYIDYFKSWNQHKNTPLLLYFVLSPTRSDVWHAFIFKKCFQFCFKSSEIHRQLKAIIYQVCARRAKNSLLTFCFLNFLFKEAQKHLEAIFYSIGTWERIQIINWTLEVLDLKLNSYEWKLNSTNQKGKVLLVWMEDGFQELLLKFSHLHLHAARHPEGIFPFHPTPPLMTLKLLGFYTHVRKWASHD